MKTTIYIVAAIILIGYSLDLKITFKPFSITSNGLLNTVGWILIAAAVLCFQQDYYRKGMKRGSEISKEVIRDVLIEEKNKEVI